MKSLFPYRLVKKVNLHMRNIFKTKIFKRICFILLIVYVSAIFINQQKTLASYNSQKKYYQEKITAAKENNEKLIAEKNNLNSNSYIEKIAREKLDMCTENERVYVDIDK